jgi:hypothetical protein
MNGKIKKENIKDLRKYQIGLKKRTDKYCNSSQQIINLIVTT